MKYKCLRIIFGVTFFLGGFGYSQNQETIETLLVDNLWKFYPGYEFPGSTGKCVMDKDGELDVVNLWYDFSGNNKGGYVAMKRKLEKNADWIKLSFEAKADRNLALVVRVVDSTKQVFQYPVKYTQNNNWQLVELDLTRLDAFKFFAGAGDGQLHPPILEIWVGIGKTKFTEVEAGFGSFSKLKIIEKPSS